jgi:myo-inositol-1(or 4)-monophosphatase
MHPLANIGLRAGRIAAEHILQAWQHPDRIKISEKGYNDYVTDIDRLVEDILVEHIRKSYPSHSFLCEEAGLIEGEDTETIWVIDPIDGTRNFVLGFPHFCISMACIKKGSLEHAIIIDPIKNEEFTASKGSGALLNGNRIRVGNRQSIEGAMVSLSSSGLENYETLLQIQNAMKGIIGAVRITGSAALDLAYMAAGRTDAGWMSGMNQWDVAAGMLLIQEAGGLISDSGGNPDCLNSESLVFGNAKCFKDWLKLVSKPG